MVCFYVAESILLPLRKVGNFYMNSHAAFSLWESLKFHSGISLPAAVNEMNLLFPTPKRCSENSFLPAVLPSRCTRPIDIADRPTTIRCS